MYFYPLIEYRLLLLLVVVIVVLISIAGSESTSTWQEGNKKREDGERGSSSGGGGAGGNDYSKEATILNISIYRGWLFKGGDESKNDYYLRKYNNKCFCLNDICLIKHAIHMYIHKKYCL